MAWYLSPSGWPTYAADGDTQSNLLAHSYTPMAEADVPAAVAAFQAAENSPPSTQLPGWALATDVAAALALKLSISDIPNPDTTGGVELRAALVPRAVAQTAENDHRRVFTAQPFTAGQAPYVEDFNSFPNQGAGAGTFNHAWHSGYNAGRHSGGAVTSGKPGWYIGLEDNYYDHADQNTFGTEWYVGYISPDGTTVPVGALRPFYARVNNSDTNNAADKSVRIHADIGQGPDGSFSVWGSVQNGNQIVAINQTAAIFVVDQVAMNASILSVAPASGQAKVLIQSADEVTDQNAQLVFGIGGVQRFMFEADRFGEIYLWDNTNGRIHTNFVRGATADASLLDVRATLQLSNTTATSAAAGAATALPATPAGYFQVKDPAGVTRKVPYYA